MDVSWIFQIIIAYSISAAIGFLSIFGLVWQVVLNGLRTFQVKSRTQYPEIAQDSKWGKHRYVSLVKQGIKVHYVENGEQNKPLMLFIHGFPECWFQWRHQLAEFSKNYWVVALDMRGYADSDKPPCVNDYKMPNLVDDIKEFLETLGASKCTILAHDWGGVIAWEAVAKYPDLFTRHVSINGPHPVAYYQCLRNDFHQLFLSWYVFFFQIPYLPELLIRLNDFEALEKALKGRTRKSQRAFPDDVIEVYKFYAQKSGGLKYPINYYRGNFLKSTPLKELTKIPKIKVPSLIIWGTEDSALSKEIPKEMTKLCEDVQLKYVEGASHFVAEEEPEYVNELITEYIKITQ